MPTKAFDKIVRKNKQKNTLLLTKPGLKPRHLKYRENETHKMSINFNLGKRLREQNKSDKKIYAYEILYS